MSGRYDRRPRREWEDRGTRRGIGQSIGGVRVLGLMVIFAGSFVLLNKKDAPAPAPTQPAGGARIAVDTAIAPTLNALIPKATLRTGTSQELAADIRAAVSADVAVLLTDDVAALVEEGRCSDALPIAKRASASYSACAVNADGSSRELAARTLNALTGISGREALLIAGFDVPEQRPPSLSTTP